jgi:nucleotide-binding universal stress UspA family protein
MLSHTAMHPLAAVDAQAMLACVLDDEVSGCVVCGIGRRDAAPRLVAFAAALAKPLGARLTAVRVEPATPASADGLYAALGRARTGALQQGRALLREVLSEAERAHAVTRKVDLGDPRGRLDSRS